MGVFTTLIFWLTEYAFHLVFLTDEMRYIGAILGLSVGYYVKYQLDKRFVFIKTGVGI
jgi:positive regulator of sigma E activity